MRTVVNISLPEHLTREVEKRVRRGDFATKSEFFRQVLRHWLEEEKIAQDIASSRKDIEGGKGKTLRSLKDLR